MKEDNDNIKVISNVFMLLDMIFDQGKMGIREMAKKTGLAKTTVFRIIKTLQSLNIVEQDIDEQYYLGLTLSKYASYVNNSLNLVQIATPYMKELAKDIGESVNLGILHEEQALMIHTEMGEAYTLQLILKPVSPLYCSSIGKIFLAEMTAQEQKNYFDQPLQTRTVNTITTFQQFERELPNIKNTLIAYDSEEYEYGLSCLATPIKNRHGEVIAAISISGPTTRLAFKGIDKIEQTIKEYAKRISHTA